MLKALRAGCHPKQVIAELSEDALAHYKDKPLIEPYDIYQHLMDYWAKTMQDDCYLIAADGWKAETSRIIETDKKGKQKDKGWTCDLAPKALLVAHFYASEQAAIDKLSAEVEDIAAKLTELEEEQVDDEDAFAEARTDAEDGKQGKVTRATVTVRLKAIKGDKEAKDEAEILERWLELDAEQTLLKKKLKEAETVLDAKAYARYPRLTENEVKALVVDDKWLAALDAAIHAEMDRVSQQLTQRVKELGERYESPMPRMLGRVAELEAKVNRHLVTMGFAWA